MDGMTDKDRLDFLEGNPEIILEIAECIYNLKQLGLGLKCVREIIDHAYKEWAERQDLLDTAK